MSLLLSFIAAFLLGISKSGFKGLGIFVVVLLAINLEAKSSTGVLMPLLILADCFAIVYYRKDVNWKLLFQILPAMLFGVLFGVYVGEDIPKSDFKKIMSVIVFFSGFMMLFFERMKKSYVPKGWWFATLMGLGAGFATMIGNLAGAFANLYFLALNIPKKKFIGTSAWLFFIVNLFKLPFHIFVWKTINIESIIYSGRLALFVIIGFYIGLRLIKYLSNEVFKKYVIIITIIGAIVIYFK
ncbi:MAG: sulfite exporter TauE/SafE family protein [Saprospiraceae bacterium]|nr:sulfite exporter TauE/SafE family protein [Bacteroidia bacterium]NNE14237.1 sulfite exporter TauE/SafE family protein [Saprospiraceae bacterium]NNL92176.1 sulfite exporter TauE/SafE family protein [Saprospiraceae bacterium]